MTIAWHARLVQPYQLILKKGIDEVVYSHGYYMSGTYFYSLVVDDKKIDSGKMVFTR
ncbi:MAG: hypothetical protein JST82_16355 [Bacteroidetes bacterium]|nr:hypothetical protein [Bacteroidota bacterium]